MDQHHHPTANLMTWIQQMSPSTNQGISHIVAAILLHSLMAMEIYGMESILRMDKGDGLGGKSDLDDERDDIVLYISLRMPKPVMVS